MSAKRPPDPCPCRLHAVFVLREWGAGDGGCVLVGGRIASGFGMVANLPRVFAGGGRWGSAGGWYLGSRSSPTRGRGGLLAPMRANHGL